MRKKVVLAVLVGIIIGIVIGVFAVFPGIFAWTHHINFFETWYNMFAF